MLQGKTEAELAYLVGKHLAFLLPQHAMASLYGPARLEALALAAETFLHPAAEIPPGMEPIRDAAEAIEEVIAPADEERLRRLMPVLRDRHSSGIIQEFLNNVEKAANRSGLLVCDDLAVASRGIQGGGGMALGDLSGGGQIRELVAWMLSDEYFEARKIIGASA